MSEYEKLRRNILFNNLSDDDFNSLLKITQKIVIEANSYLIHEGDIAEKFYFILSGSIAIIKEDPHHKHEHYIATLTNGDTVGEMALLDRKPRSASAKAITHTELLSFSFEGLHKLANQSAAFDKMLLHITKRITHRFRETNTTVVEALEKQLNEYKIRTGLGLFMINVIVALCLFTYFLSWINSQQTKVIASTVLSLPLTLGFVLLLILIMKGSKLPLETFGLTTKNWKKALFESIFFTFIVCLLVNVVKWIMVNTKTSYFGLPIFSPYLTINLNKDSGNWSYEEVWWIIFAVYWIIISPLQELIVRGGLQSPLEFFLTGKYATFKAIFVSNIMFSTTHLFLGISTSIMVFFAGIYFGWLYSRHGTLIGVIFAHSILGTWATMVVGF